MKKITTMGTAVVLLATMLLWQGGQAAEKPTKEATPKAPPKTAASNATSNAAKADRKSVV